jgi:hypothetical protein
MPMKTSSGAKPLSRTKARNCVLINQLGTPGLGSCMAGRWLAGTGQLLVALVGSAMIIGWFGQVAKNTYNLWFNDAEPKAVGWLGEAGGLTLLASWLWAGVSSFQILRSAEGNEPKKEPPPLN